MSCNIQLPDFHNAKYNKNMFDSNFIGNIFSECFSVRLVTIIESVFSFF